MFQAYDYRENGNLLAYGSNKPLVYNLGKVTAPVFKLYLINRRRKFFTHFHWRIYRFTYSQAEMTTLLDQRSIYLSKNTFG